MSKTIIKNVALSRIKIIIISSIVNIIFITTPYIYASESSTCIHVENLQFINTDGKASDQQFQKILREELSKEYLITENSSNADIIISGEIKEQFSYKTDYHSFPNPVFIILDIVTLGFRHWAIPEALREGEIEMDDQIHIGSGDESAKLIMEAKIKVNYNQKITNKNFVYSIKAAGSEINYNHMLEKANQEISKRIADFLKIRFRNLEK